MLKVIGLIEDNESFDTLITIYNILKNFLNLKVVVSFKKIFKDTSFTNFDDYFSYLSANSTDLLILKLKPSEFYLKDSERINFDILILSDARKCSNLESINANYLIYNYDSCEPNKFIQNMRSNKCSYGLSYNADFFPSSIEEEFASNKIMFCINKSISTLSGNILEVQEFLIKTNISVENKIYNILASLVCCLILDIKIQDLVTQFELLIKEEKINA